jgi:hypothetical protein
MSRPGRRRARLPHADEVNGLLPRASAPDRRPRSCQLRLSEQNVRLIDLPRPAKGGRTTPELLQGQRYKGPGQTIVGSYTYTGSQDEVAMV